MSTQRYTALLQREVDGYVAIYPELDVASQGNSVEEARANLKEAVEPFLESASPQEVKERLHTEPVPFAGRFRCCESVGEAY